MSSASNRRRGAGAAPGARPLGADAEGVPHADAAPAGGDGRRLRRDRNRIAVLEALQALVLEGHWTPRVEEVAARAGVSLRSLYRYFPDFASMMEAALDLNFERGTAAVPVLELGVGSLEQRIDRFVEVRVALYEGLAPSVRIARTSSIHNEVIRARFDAGRQVLRAQVEAQFAEELARLGLGDRTTTVAAADALCQLETLFYLRVDRGLTPAVVAQTMRDALWALLARSGSS